ncbi:hypothetical protein BDY19DRAFT_966226 [Irpex rosettiformis]|uniref:Uncharacterized protein n=1 Tax=Irpex rosettiformis TaxID=378272 RepID=A0ACB8TTW8_9APHY|nr:hypothetical protein BDY19DRAFT_966226 [Irpex rosettiformis]
MAKSRNGPTSRRQMTQALPPIAELDTQRVALLGRGQRELHPTERSLPFRQSIEKQNARLNAQRDRHLVLTSIPQHDDLDLEEEREREEDPCAEDDLDSGVEDRLCGEDDGHQVFNERNIFISTHSEPHMQASTASRPTKKLASRVAVSRIALPLAASQPVTQITKASSSKASLAFKDNMNTAGNKRAPPVEISDDDDDTSEMPAKRSKPKAGDYVGSQRAHLLRACSLFRVAISTQSAFPDGVELDQLVYDSFISADETEFGAQSEPNDNELKVIKARASQLRGQLVTNAKNLIKHTYGFSSTDAQEATVEANRIKYDCFTDRAAFSYETPGARTPGTMFKNSIFLEVAQKTWFRHCRDEGIMFHESFDRGPGFPLPALALIIVAVKNGLDEWKTGIYASLDFTEKGYADEYLAILDTLRDWHKLTDQSGTQTAAKFQVEFLRRCRASVGICENVTAVPTNSQLTYADLLADEEPVAADPE